MRRVLSIISSCLSLLRLLDSFCCVQTATPPLQITLNSLNSLFPLNMCRSQTANTLESHVVSWLTKYSSRKYLLVYRYLHPYRPAMLYGKCWAATDTTDVSFHQIIGGWILCSVLGRLWMNWYDFDHPDGSREQCMNGWMMTGLNRSLYQPVCEHTRIAKCSFKHVLCLSLLLMLHVLIMFCSPKVKLLPTLTVKLYRSCQKRRFWTLSDLFRTSKQI